MKIIMEKIKLNDAYIVRNPETEIQNLNYKENETYNDNNHQIYHIIFKEESHYEEPSYN